ncbi:hypothetical protein OIU78_018185 [Salix suchowensis]|nr:hypothetical protein OIU78_018185 [Salix suchowensis]
MDLTSSSSAAQSLTLSSSPKTINSSRSKDFIDLMNPPPPPPQDDSQSHNNNDDDLDDGIKREEIVASYDFQPIRPVFDPTAADSKSISSSASPLRVSLRLLLGFFTVVWLRRILVFVLRDGKIMVLWTRLNQRKSLWKRIGNVFDAASIISEIDRTMNKFSDNLLHALEGVSARLTQLESRTRHLENSVDDLKLSVGNNHESTQGNMIHLHNILREVQTGVQVLKDKQETARVSAAAH